MKELKWKIIWCLFPTLLGLLVLSVAGYNYSHPPLKIGRGTPWWLAFKFNLGVDLVGGTILVYEIDPDKKPENYNKDQLISALKRRLDPADLYNITIRPLSDTRVEIILPTGGRHQLDAQKIAWNDLLAAVEKEWPAVSKEKLTARRGDRSELSQQIREIDPSIKPTDIEKLIDEEYSSETQLTRDRVEATKELIQRVGSLEFRVLANRNDDTKALDDAKTYFDAAAESWKKFLDKVREKYPDADKAADKDSAKLDDVAAGDLEGVADLIVKRRPTEDRGSVKAWMGNFKFNPQMTSLMKRAESGQPPEPPMLGEDGKKYRITTLNDGEHRVSYAWVELGKNELHSLHLNNDAKAEPLWRAAAVARNKGELLEHYTGGLDGRARNQLPGAYDPTSRRDFRVPLYSRKITDPNRLSAKDKDKKYEYFFLTRDAEPGREITGEMLTNAKEDADKSGGRAVAFRFNAKGEGLFYDLTNANSPPSNDRESRRLLAITLDGQIMSAPGVETAIRGSGIIHGQFSKAEIDSLVNILRSGALPATLKPQPVSENTLGATLGEDTINKGTMSIAIAFGAILVFMLVYYRFAGFVACIALIVNLILTIAFMVIVNATFTLPGLAGLVLTLGMAVDANVLIYERLREERERGAGLALALRNGYERALPTIIDTHLTSILTAIVLYIVGNDQLKGFGISLTVGLLISLFTALFVTRVIFRIWELNGWLKELSMVKLFSKPNFHFMAIRKPVFIITVGTALFGVAIFIARGRASLNMDFIGGTVYSGELSDFKNINELRADLEKESHQKEMLALATDPEFDKVRGLWKLTYKAGEEADRVHYVSMTENVTPVEMRQRAETLPEPSVEQIFTADPKLSKENESKLFTVRTTEKSAKLVAASVSRLLGDKLKKTKLDSYTIQTVSLFFPKAMTVEEARRVVMPALEDAKLIERRTKNVALQALPLAGGALSAVANVLSHGDQASLVGKEAGPQAGTFKVMELNLLKTPPQGDKLLAALQPLTEDDTEKKKDRTFNLNVTSAQLNLDDHVYLSQVKTLMDSVLKGEIAQEVTLSEVDRKDEIDGRYQKMKVGLPPVDGNKFAKAMEKFASDLQNNPLPVRLENFDSQLAADMQQRALYAIVASWGAMLLFLWFRFGNWTFGLAAVLCLVHDVCFTLGIIAACHYLYPSFFTDWLLIRDFKIDLPAVAAILTLIGFSVNDTIVVFDRIREVRGKNPILTPEMINDSINQTLSRTVLTSLTAWLVVFVLYVAGGEGVHLFGFVMVVGVLVGTYSSIFVASPLLLILGEGAPKTSGMRRVRDDRPVATEGR